MDASQSKMTPVKYMLKNFKKSFIEDYVVNLKPKHLSTFFEIEWP